MATLDVSAKGSLQFSCRRHTVVLFKSVLNLLEGLALEHDEALGKLMEALPPEYAKYVGLADYFTEDKAERLRKAVLAMGNDAARNIEAEIDKYQVDFPS